MNKDRKILISVCLILVSTALMGQPPPPPATPIDGGLGVLLAGGTLYAVAQIRKRLK